MTTCAPLARPPSRHGRVELAESRVAYAEAALANCEVCVHRCAVDRTKGPAGRCGAPGFPRVFSAQVEVGDELELIPSFNIALSGCNIRCAFCVTGRHSWHAGQGAMTDLGALAARATRALRAGSAKSVLILGGEPTVHLSWLAEFAARLPEDALLILKTNGLSTASARNLLDGLFDIWIVDYKFGNDDCASDLSGTPGYRAGLEETLLWASTHTRLIVRHLVMPGHVKCCWRPIAAWLAKRLPRTKVSLRFGYWPAWRALSIPGLDTPITATAQSEAVSIAREFGLNLIP